jgi:N-acetylmuramoyl-L-alanine amidase
MDDSPLTLSQRVAMISMNAPDLFVSIHTNAHTSSSIKGIEAYYITEAGKLLAQSIYDALTRSKGEGGLGEPGNWVRKRELYVINHNIAPAALIEIGYLSNDTSRSHLMAEDYQGQIAASIYKGILGFIALKRAKSAQLKDAEY